MSDFKIHPSHEIDLDTMTCMVCSSKYRDNLVNECTKVCRNCDNTGYWYAEVVFGPCDCVNSKTVKVS